MSIFDTVKKEFDHVTTDLRGHKNNLLNATIRNQRQTKLEIVNKSGKNIKSLLVKHKYSGDFFDNISFGLIKDGGSVVSEQLVVYATGIVTIGVDWWFVAGLYEDGAGFFTDESLGSKALDTAIFALNTTLGSVAAVTTGGLSKLADAAGLSISNEPTTGFKKYTLPAEAEQRPVRIIIRPGDVGFDANGAAEDSISTIGLQPGVWRGNYDRLIELRDFRGGAQYLALAG